MDNFFPKLRSNLLNIKKCSNLAVPPDLKSLRLMFSSCEVLFPIERVRKNAKIGDFKLAEGEGFEPSLQVAPD